MSTDIRSWAKPKQVSNVNSVSASQTPSKQATKSKSQTPTSTKKSVGNKLQFANYRFKYSFNAQFYQYQASTVQPKIFQKRIFDAQLTLWVLKFSGALRAPRT